MAAKSRKEKADRGPVAVNKKAYRDYELIEKFEAGLSLLGAEVKSLRAGQADLAGSYARVEKGQGWLVGANIARYEKAGTAGHEPTRKRRLLLHKTELRRIQIKLEQRGFTFVPLRIYFNDRGLAKVELALARGKRKYDKRTKITERAQKREVNRGTKKYRR
jgi:SsrA-binding protein